MHNVIRVMAGPVEASTLGNIGIQPDPRRIKRH